MLLMVNHECISSIVCDVSSNISFLLKCKMIPDGFFCRPGFDSMFLNQGKKLRLASSITYSSKSKVFLFFKMRTFLVNFIELWPFFLGHAMK